MMIEIHCPECKGSYTLKRGLRVGNGDVKENELPVAGDHTVCHLCFAVLTLSAEGWRGLSDQEWLDLSVDERRGLKAMQDAVRKTMESGADKDPVAELAESMGIDEIRLHMRIHDLPAEVRRLLPWLTTMLVLKKGGSEQKVIEMMVNGLKASMRVIMERPDTTYLEDLKLVVPILYAEAYLASKGDAEKTKELFKTYVNMRLKSTGKTMEELGLDDLLGGLL